MKKLLLISNSVSYGKKYLEHCDKEINDFLKDTNSLLFIPYASSSPKEYTKFVSNHFKKNNIKVKTILTDDPIEAINKAKAIFVGGGNTFKLLKTLQDLNLLKPLQDKILNNTPYIGSSAGVNIACPTIKTTNDMPIIFPKSFNALNLIPFQINPHYIDKDLSSKHQGETREERIKEFMEENNIPVLGLYENSWIIVNDSRILLKGENGAKLFKKNNKPIILKNGPIKIS